jgi:hypothetical protein
MLLLRHIVSIIILSSGEFLANSLPETDDIRIT